MGAETYTAVRDEPTKIALPENAPPYFKDYISQVEEWSRTSASATRQLQSKIADLETRIAALEAK